MRRTYCVSVWGAIFYFCLSFAPLHGAATRAPYAKDFGGWQISRELFDYIRLILPEGSTMLELGSGWGSSQLALHYTLYSVEHDPVWVDRYDSHYIYAPLVDGWYDVQVLERTLPKYYDLILVDGPPGHVGIGRIGFFHNLRLFRTDVPIIFDDVDRPAEYALMVQVATALRKPYQVFPSGAKKFGVVR